MMFTDIKIKYIKWYAHLWLWLAQTRRVWDMEDGSILIYKMWWGKIYILGVYGTESIHVHRKGWKKLGFKGRVEVWTKDGKFISAHPTVQDAFDSIPPRKHSKAKI